MSKREDVLARVFAILGTVAGVQSCVRNRGLLDNDKRPALILMDGDERSKPSSSDRPGRAKMTPIVVNMTPQVFVVLKTVTPQNVNVGQDLNAFRAAIITALSKDTQLLSIIGPNGDVSYDGCETDLKSGAAMEGQVRLDFTISCVMNPYSP